jgi:hypothetical protein
MHLPGCYWCVTKVGGSSSEEETSYCIRREYLTADELTMHFLVWNASKTYLDVLQQLQ